MQILLAEDDKLVRITLRDALEDAGHQVFVFEDGAAALAACERAPFDLMISDVRLPVLDGISLFRHLRRLQPDCDALLMTAFGQIEDAVAVIREGARDYITKPFELEELMLRVARIAETQRFRRTLASGQRPVDGERRGRTIVGASPAIEEVRRRIEAAAESDVSVLVTGETGTGKELCARTLHLCSSRAEQPLVHVNCASIPTDLFEAEMFGHERGAFTGAVRRREGRLLAADHGTLLLDEVGELPLEHQAKLLRALDSQTFEPVGSSRPVKVDVRVVAATNRDLQEAVDRGAFRSDLLYRLRVLEIRMPPLRDRRADIPLLASDFLGATARRRGGSLPGLSPAAMAALICYDYPGNVRELFHALEHGVALARSGAIALEHLPATLRQSEAPPPDGPTNGGHMPLSEAVHQFEQIYIRRVLEQVAGKRGEAARVLGISRKSLWQKLKEGGAAGGDEGESPNG